MAFLYEKSRTWRLIVANGKASPRFFAAFSALCVGVPIALGAVVMNATNPGGERASQRSKELVARGRNQSTAAVIGEVNRQRLGQLLKEIHAGDDTEDRYKAALKGETMTGTPGARIRGVAAGTSMRSPSAPDRGAAVRPPESDRRLEEQKLAPNRSS